MSSGSSTKPRLPRIGTALMWEVLAAGWQGVLIAELGALLFSSLYISLLWDDRRATFEQSELGFALHLASYSLTVIAVGSAILIGVGNPHRRYTLPASSVVIVGCSMLCAMATGFGLYALQAIVTNFAFGTDWTVIGPGLVFALLIGMAQAILWSMANSSGLQFSAGLLATIAIALVISVLPVGISPKTGFFAHVTLSGLLAFGGATGICLAAGTFGFDKLRHGSGIDVKRLVDFVSDRLTTAARSRPFAKPTSAQLWFEWRSRGLVLPVLVFVIGTAALVVAMSVRVEDAPKTWGGFSAVLLEIAAIMGLYWGSRSETGEVKSFAGSRPLTDAQMANAVLKSSTISLVVGTLVWGMFLVAGLGILAARGGAVSDLVSKLWGATTLQLGSGVLLASLTLWSVSALMTSLSMAGRRVLALVIYLVVVVLVIFPIAIKYAIPGEFRAAFSHWYYGVCLGLCPVFEIGLFVRGWQRQLISLRIVALAGVLAIAGSASLIEAYGDKWSFSQSTTIAQLPILALCCLIPLPLAAAPLAVWWNRHR